MFLPSSSVHSPPPALFVWNGSKPVPPTAPQLLSPHPSPQPCLWCAWSLISAPAAFLPRCCCQAVPDAQALPCFALGLPFPPTNPTLLRASVFHYLRAFPPLSNLCDFLCEISLILQRPRQLQHAQPLCGHLSSLACRDTRVGLGVVWGSRGTGEPGLSSSGGRGGGAAPTPQSLQRKRGHFPSESHECTLGLSRHQCQSGKIASKILNGWDEADCSARSPSPAPRNYP